MKIIVTSVVFALFLGIFMTTSSAFADANSLYSMSASRIEGNEQKLSDYKGKVALVVNVASRCGYTPQYDGLEALYKKYRGRGFVVLAFPSNDFGQQEPGSNEEIKAFCSSKYGVSFPLFAKGPVTGPSKQPIYRLLIASTGATEVGWNFEKFLVNRDGLVVDRFASGVEPDSQELATAIERLLG
jgi:glutathione peroxidase